MSSEPAVMYIARETRSWYKTGPNSSVTRTTFSWFKVTGDLINAYIRPRVAQEPKRYTNFAETCQEQEEESFPGEQVEGRKARFDQGEASERFTTLQDEDTYPREDIETPSPREGDNPAYYAHQDEDTYPREDCEVPATTGRYKKPTHPSLENNRHLRELPYTRRGKKSTHPSLKNDIFPREKIKGPSTRSSKKQAHPSKKNDAYSREESEGPSTRSGKRPAHPSQKNDIHPAHPSQKNDTYPREESEGPSTRKGKRPAHSLPAGAITPVEKRPRRSTRRKVIVIEE